MATKIDRLGETRMMNCGMEATIIRYGKYSDIDVRFEDGAVVKHKDYGKFKKGNIAHPNTTAEDRLGETRMMNCGMEATIIRYGGSSDIDVRFEDGVIAKCKRYGEFKKGGIANPNIKASAENRLGEARMMNCGMEATIVRYGNNGDIDVRFEDGAVVVHKAYDSFKKGNIANPNIKAFAENRLGETRMMNCGMEATIIRYGKYKDIDVRFEDGAVAKNKAYGKFKKGTIANPKNKASRLGETRMMNCGMEATIIRYENAMDIDVRFEDGTVVEHKTYDAFKKGTIVNQNIKASAENRLGETRMMNCGMEATIIRYGGVRDIDVCFKDGTVAEHKVYNAFEKGNIAHPNTTAKARLGETRMMNCGMEATIIRYGGAADIDVRFEDESVVEHKTYDNFKRGTIAHRSLNLSHGSKDFHGFICKQGFKDEDRTLYECICKHCGLEDVLTPQEMMEHEKSEHGEDK